MAKGGKTTQTQTVDPGTANLINQIHQTAGNVSQEQMPGWNSLDTQAQQGYQQAQNLGSQGMSALGGNAAAMQNFMNPYTQSVINAMNQNWGNLSGQVTLGADAQATAQGAFGGSRSGVAEGAALNQLGQGQMQQMAGLEQSGYANAQNLAQNAANLGFSASGALGGLGQYQQQLAEAGQQYGLNTLKSGMVGPSSTTNTTQQSSNPLSAILGLAGTVGGALIGGPGGAAAGAQLGGGGPAIPQNNLGMAGQGQTGLGGMNLGFGSDASAPAPVIGGDYYAPSPGLMTPQGGGGGQYATY